MKDVIFSIYNQNQSNQFLVYDDEKGIARNILDMTFNNWTIGGCHIAESEEAYIKLVTLFCISYNSVSEDKIEVSLDANQS